MKGLVSFLLIFSLVFFPTGILLAQPISSKVHDLYKQSVAYPEKFDSSIELLEASGLMKEEILSCLVPLREKYFQLAKVTIDQCKTAHGGNPQKEWECLKNDPSASLAYWADGMIQVIKDEKKWVNTYTGSNMVTAKALSEQIQGGAWVEQIRLVMPVIKNMITCP